MLLTPFGKSISDAERSTREDKPLASATTPKNHFPGSPPPWPRPSLNQGRQRSRYRAPPRQVLAGPIGAGTSLVLMGMDGSCPNVEDFPVGSSGKSWLDLMRYPSQSTVVAWSSAPSIPPSNTKPQEGSSTMMEK